MGCTVALTMLGLYYEHFIFFAPLVALLGLYCIFFVVHKIVPGKDNHDSRKVMFFLMIMITMATLAYGILFANELFNKVPNEICEAQAGMDKKTCLGWITGIRGNLLVFCLTVMNLYFSYIHLQYLNEMTEVMKDGQYRPHIDEANADPNNPYAGRQWS